MRARRISRAIGVILALTGLFVAFQFTLFEPRPATITAKFVFESAFLFVVLAVLLTIPRLSVGDEVALPLVLGLGAFVMQSATDIADEFLAIPESLLAVFEEGLMILGFALLLVGLRREAAVRDEREERLREQNDRLETFAAVLSHDLRNPLQVAIGRIDIAREATDGDDEHLDAAANALERMEEIIEDVLTLVRTDAESVETTTVSVATAAREAWETVATPDAELSVADDADVAADGSLLRQLFENLFRNAVEHGGEAVAVDVGSLADASGFYVADDGPGIPEDEREAVFETGHSGGDGTGLGLAIGREIVRAHGWTIDVTESDSGGARFEIRTESA